MMIAPFVIILNMNRSEVSGSKVNKAVGRTSCRQLTPDFRAQVHCAKHSFIKNYPYWNYSPSEV